MAIATLVESAETLLGEGDERGLGRAIYLTCLVHAWGCNNAAQAAAAEAAATHYAAAGFSPTACQVNYLLALYDGSVDVATAAARCAELLGSASDAMTEANAMSVLGALQGALAGAADDGLALLDQARPLTEDIEISPWSRVHLTLARIEAEVAAGLLQRSRARTSECGRVAGREERRMRVVVPLTLADLYFALQNDDGSRGRDGVGGGVRVPTRRPRPVPPPDKGGHGFEPARAPCGQGRSAGKLTVSITSLTDANLQRSHAPCDCRRARPQGRRLLRRGQRKWICRSFSPTERRKGALVRAPSI